MEKKILEEIDKILDVIESGGKFCVSKCHMGFDISEEVNLIITNALINYIDQEGGNNGK